MLSVYICEDEEEVRRIQRECLEKQIMIQGYDMEIALCSGRPGEILEAVEKNPGRGIYFLDVELKGEEMDGFALGREIRRLDPRGFIVYVTAYGNLAFETFRYHLEALDYIVKESMEKMEEGLGKSLSVITERIMSRSRYSVVLGESSSCPLTSPQSKASSTSVFKVTFMCCKCFT